MPWIIAGAALIGGVASSMNAKSGRKAAQKSLTEARNYAVNDSGLSDYKNSGLAANKTINDLLGNNGGDTSSSDAAFEKYLNSSGYKFQQQQGQQALTTSAAAKGMLNSGSAAKAEIKFGQGLGASYFNSYLGQQNQVANRGANASSNLAQIYTGAGSSLASNSVAGANEQNDILNGGLKDFATYVGDQRGTPAAAPAAGKSSGNIFGPNPTVNFTANDTLPGARAA